MSEQIFTNEEQTKPPRRGRGRPKGTPNKLQRAKGEINAFNQAANKSINRELGNIATVSLATFGQQVGALQEIQVPRIRIQALGLSGMALELLADFVKGVEKGGQEAPASIRRLAALDILNIAGITTTSQAIEKQTATNKPVSELNADELRAMLSQQRAAIEKLDQGLGRVVNEAEG